jgi:thiol-disulfide isomerase/thioredoxin
MSLKLGDRIVPFSLPGVDGADHGPREGRVTAVVFWCNHCPYVRAWEDRLIALARGADDVDVIAVGANDADRDESQEVARAYGGERTPDVFLFGSDGALAYHGAIDDSWEPDEIRVSYLEQAIAALRAGDAPVPATSKIVGCTIKWR